MTAAELFGKYLEANGLLHKVDYLTDSKYPVIIHIFKKSEIETSETLVSFGLPPGQARLGTEYMYNWVHGKLVAWIMERNGQL
jgi:hypothetical protein